jgi:hypothetical protein
VIGTLASGSGIQPDGSVRFIVDKTQLGITTGDVLFGVAVREDTANSPSGVIAADYAGGRQDYLLVGNDFCTAPPQLVSVVSRKTHGAAGDFNVALPLTGTRGVECRTGNVNLVFSFAAPVTNCGTATQGTVSGGPEVNQCTVTLSNPASGQYYQVGLNGVTNFAGGTGNFPGPQWGLLIGDVNASGVVTSGDTNLCKAQALQPVTTSNFRNDINASGSITTGDVNLIKQHALEQLPPP